MKNRRRQSSLRSGVFAQPSLALALASAPRPTRRPHCGHVNVSSVYISNATSTEQSGHLSNCEILSSIPPASLATPPALTSAGSLDKKSHREPRELKAFGGWPTMRDPHNWPSRSRALGWGWGNSALSTGLDEIPQQSRFSVLVWGIKYQRDFRVSGEGCAGLDTAGANQEPTTHAGGYYGRSRRPCCR